MAIYRLEGKLAVGWWLDVEAATEEEAVELGERLNVEACVGEGSTSGLVRLSVRGAHFETTDCYPEVTHMEKQLDTYKTA